MPCQTSSDSIEAVYRLVEARELLVDFGGESALLADVPERNLVGRNLLEVDARPVASVQVGGELDERCRVQEVLQILAVDLFGLWKMNRPGI